MEQIDKLRETDVDDIPESSRFLLEMDYGNLMKSNTHNKTYWVGATETAIKAGQGKDAHGARKRTQLNKHQRKPIRKRPRIIEAEKDIRSNCWAYTAIRGEGAMGSSHGNTVINTPSKRKSIHETSEVVTRTNKRDTSQVTSMTHGVPHSRPNIRC